MPATKKNEKDIPQENKLHFNYLPEYASFLLEQHLEPYIKEQIKYSREENTPLLRVFANLTDEQLLELGRPSHISFLKALIENNIQEFIRTSTESYVKNLIPDISNEQVVAEDITIISFIRKKSLRKFLPLYTQDFTLLINVLDEVDRFIIESETSSFNAYIGIQQKKIQEINADLELKQEQLLEAQELTDMGSFFWDLTGGNSVYTPGIFKIFELEKADNMVAFMENVHEEDIQKLKKAIDDAITGKGIYECEYRFIKNNKEKNIWSRGVVNFKEGKPLSMRGIVMDVTNKYKLLETLVESEKLSKQSQAITHIGNWAWDITANKITWSDEMYRVYGLEPQSEEITFERFISLIHPDDREKRMKEIQESLKTLLVSDYILRIINPDGTIKVIKGKGEVVTDKKNTPVKLVGSCQDVTIEYKLNKEIHEKEEYLNQLINNAPDAVIVMDDSNNVHLWNPKTEEIFGWKTEEVLNRNLIEIIIPPQYRKGADAAIKDLLNGGVQKAVNRSIELTALNKQNVEFYISLTISKLMQEGKHVFILFLRDITSEKQTKTKLQNNKIQLEKLNTSLELKNTELERTNKELESFNYIASHDLQEPLRKIQLFSNRILETGKSNLTPTTTEYFNKIITSAARMQLLIQDLLAFSRTTATEDDFELVDMNIILEDVKSLLSSSIEDSKAIIDSTLLPVLKGLPFQLQQLLSNLISNSIKYSRENVPPHIIISSSIVKGQTINDYAVSSNKMYFEIKVEDNGIGFDEKNAEKIFGLFQRLHNKDKYSGTGIGLAICKKIINNHNGFIIAKSVAGKGSVFYIYFPLEIPSPKPRNTIN